MASHTFFDTETTLGTMEIPLTLGATVNPVLGVSTRRNLNESRVLGRNRC